ncbi:reverse transcriptase [Trichuris suis]|nr:reverse transcriptase [Trichuris suis]
MERLLKPDKLDVDPSSPTVAIQWRHWRATFEYFLALPSGSVDPKALLQPRIAETLKDTFERPVNEVHARHRLATRKQQPGESIDEFVRALNILSTECNFKAVSATQYREELIRDAFVSGLHSQTIRQRLLESRTCDLASCLDIARILESAQKTSEAYSAPPTPEATVAASAADTLESGHSSTQQESCLAAPPQKSRCFFCDLSKHLRSQCPAREVICYKFLRPNSVSQCTYYLATNSTVRQQQGSRTTSRDFPFSLSKAVIEATIKGKEVSCLLDSGSSESFIHPRTVNSLRLKSFPSRAPLAMASSALIVTTRGHTIVSMLMKGRHHDNVCLAILPNLCVDVILGQDFQRRHESLTVSYGGELPPVTVCGSSSLHVDPPRLFAHLSPDCRPNEIQKLLKEGVIEPSNSPWRAQVLVTKDEERKSRLVIDYSKTIDRFTLLDSYPLPRIDVMVQNMAKYKFFSTIDLKSAYQQVPIHPVDEPFTAFEVAGGLYQFTRIPFDVTNGVACFQRIIDTFIRDEKLKGTFAYLDDITICGTSKDDHDRKLERFLKAAKKWNLTFNEEKSTFASTKLRILGYEVEDGKIRPDPSRLCSITYSR